MTIYDPTLGAGFAKKKSYEMGVDINLGTLANPIWQPIRRISDVVPSPTQQTQDSATYDNQGSPESEVVGIGWGLGFNVQVNRHQTTGLYAPEVERLNELADSKGPDAVGHFRWYDKPSVGAPHPKAKEGFGTVAPARPTAGADGQVEQLGITLSGQGEPITIANPFSGWIGNGNQPAPVIHEILPLAAGTDEIVTISGASFIGATTVTFDGDPAEKVVMDGRTIAAVMPVGAAGEIDVVVTTPTGSSTAFAYTRSV